MISRIIFFWTLVAMCWIHVYSDDPPAPAETTTSTTPQAKTQYCLEKIYDSNTLSSQIANIDKNDDSVIVIFFKRTTIEKITWESVLEEVIKNYTGLKIIEALVDEDPKMQSDYNITLLPAILFRRNKYNIKFDELDFEKLQAMLYIWFDKFYDYDDFSWPTSIQTQTCSDNPQPETTTTTETQYTLEKFDQANELKIKIQAADTEKVPVIVVFFKHTSIEKNLWHPLLEKVISNYRGLRIFEALVSEEEGNNMKTEYNISSCPVIMYQKDGNNIRFNALDFAKLQAMLYIWFSKVCFYDGYSIAKSEKKPATQTKRKKQSFLSSWIPDSIKDSWTIETDAKKLENIKRRHNATINTMKPTI